MGGSQEREFGAGGGGAATVELPVGSVLGVQASAGGLVLAAGSSAPAEANVAKQGTGSAFLGTAGVRFRPLGASRVAGPWIDANGGLAQTGSQGRPAFDGHVGWDFRVSSKTRWDVGPFFGYTQIFQPDSSLRPDDARIVWAGIQVSLGAAEKHDATLPPALEPPPAPPVPDHDGTVSVFDICPDADEDGRVPEGCPAPTVALVEDRIVIDDVIHFELNSPKIQRKSTDLVRRIAQFIVDHPAILELSIEGHADARGTEAYNQHLSEERAASTRDMLVRFGVDASRLHIVGHGESRLKVSTQLAEQANRRVEFIVTRSGSVKTSSSMRPALPAHEVGAP